MMRKKVGAYFLCMFDKLPHASHHAAHAAVGTGVLEVYDGPNCSRNPAYERTLKQEA